MRSKHTSATSSFQPSKKRVAFEHLQQLRFQVGRVAVAKFLVKARNPSYEMQVDFGPAGVKTSCGQLVNNYASGDIENQLLLGITNFPPRRIAGVKSQVLTLGFPDGVGSHQAIFISPHTPVPEGVGLSFTFPEKCSEDVDFTIFLDVEIKAGTITAIEKAGNVTVATVSLGEARTCLAWAPGDLVGGMNAYLTTQVAIWVNPLLPPSLRSLHCTGVLLTVPVERTTAARAIDLLEGVAWPVTPMVTSRPVMDGVDLF